MSKQTQQQNNGGGFMSTLKSMVNDITGTPTTTNNSQQPIKKTSSTPSKSSSLFPSLLTLQQNLPQEIQRVSSVLSNPGASLSQLEQGDAALDDLICTLTEHLHQLTEMKRSTGKKLINKLKQNVSTTEVKSPTHPVSNVRPVVEPKTQAPSVVVQPVVRATTPTNQGGFGSLANRQKPQSSPLVSSQPAVTPSKTTGGSNDLNSLLDWQENEPVNPPSSSQPQQESLIELSEQVTNSPPINVSVPPPQKESAPGLDEIFASSDDVKSDSNQNGSFLDNIVHLSTPTTNNTEMFDFSDAGEKIHQSNQILSMFDNAEPQSVPVAEMEIGFEVPQQQTTPTVDDFDF